MTITKKINPREIKRWQFADRDNYEFGDTVSLAEDIKKNGQVEPIIIRPYKDHADKYIKYEVVAGSRRWKACLDADIEVLATIKELTDQEALFQQMRENDKKLISDYSKGMHYNQILEQNLCTMNELMTISNMSRQKLRRYLRFAKIPKEIISAINNMEKVSSKSAEVICILANKGEEYKNALIEFAREIRNGAGRMKIENFVDSIINKDNEQQDKYIKNKNNNKTYGKWRHNSFVIEKNTRYNKNKLNKLLSSFFEESEENTENENIELKNKELV